VATFDYLTTQRDAAEAIRESGGAFVLSNYVDEGDVETGEVDRTESTFKGRAMPTEYESKDVDGTTILATDVKFLVSPIQDNGQPMPEIVVGGTVFFGAKNYDVVSAKPLCFDGITTVLIYVQGRAALGE
jgi:hypothetical protein